MGTTGVYVSEPDGDSARKVVMKTDDPELWSNQPVALQFVGRNCRDEQLIAHCQMIDDVIQN